jgi:dTDP-4-dehydrorhamnose 3,5-epimerase
MSARFEILDTPLHPLKVVRRKVVGDQRGYLERLFCAREFQPLLAGKTIEQINHTLTVAPGSLRGLHFQHPPHSETKVVSCIRGEVFDVAVDCRKGSPTFLRWHAEVLSADNHKAFLIPDGFAHGFQTLTENCELLYLHTACYEPGAEGALNARDPKLNISWPLPLTEVSARDAAHPWLTDEFVGVAV